jgi:hypothetical protein
LSESSVVGRRNGVGMRWRLKCCEVWMDFPRVKLSQATACRLGKVRS